MVDQFHVPFTASDSQVGFNPSLHYPDAWHALASSVHRVSPLAALGVCLFWSKMTLPRPSVASSSICIHLWRHLFTGVGAELRPTAAVLPQFVQPFWLRPGGLFRRCLVSNALCICAWQRHVAPNLVTGSVPCVLCVAMEPWCATTRRAFGKVLGVPLWPAPWPCIVG
ncbi:hypothetical protein V6N13_032105 [Hibiscus sabdariffa]